jgi:hypothetical protein
MTQHFTISEPMIYAGAEALRGKVATLGCTCPWDDEGNPPSLCACAARVTADLRSLAYDVLNAATNAPDSDEKRTR